MNFTHVRGDTLYLSLQVTDAETKQPVDITGWIVYFTVKGKPTDGDDQAVLQKVITVSEGAEGKVTITCLNTEMELTPAKYYYDIQMITAQGEVFTPIIGQITIVQDITHTR